jgi:RNA polymerase sigma-70 factor (ECF subfamily)
MEPSDNELISRAQHGEVVAFEQLVHRYDRTVLAIASRYTRNTEDAQDIYQEVFIRVYRGISSFRFESKFSTWLYRVVTNVCLSFQRKNRKVEQVPLDETFEDIETVQAAAATTTYGKTPEKLYQDVEITERVNNALDELTDKQRLVFVLKHYEGRKLREIAEIMDCAEGTVKKYLFLATRKLRAQLRHVFE